MKLEEIKSQLTQEDYEKMSRSARRITQDKTRSFMEEFKKANPEVARKIAKKAKEGKV